MASEPTASEVALLPFPEVKKAVLALFKKMLHKSFFAKPFVLKH